MAISLTGKTAVITGATGNLGQAVAERLAVAGARLVLVGRQAEALTKLSGELPADAVAATIVCDLTDEAAVARLMAEANQQGGGPEILVNAAGGYASGGLVAELDMSVWHRLMAMNLTTAVLCCKYALPYMQAGGYGRIINVAAKQAQDLPPGNAAYAVSKAALRDFTTTLAHELKGSGLAAMAILPSVIDTPANRAAMPKANTDKWVSPQTLAEVIAYLASEAGGALNGSLLPLYGGL